MLETNLSFVIHLGQGLIEKFFLGGETFLETEYVPLDKGEAYTCIGQN